LRKIELSLIQKFALSSALVLIFLGWGVGTFTTRSLEKQLVLSTQDYISRLIGDVLHSHYRPEEFLTPKLNDDYRNFQEKLYTHLPLPNAVGIKIYNPAGTIIWSDIPELVGKNFLGDLYLQKALKGELKAVITNIPPNKYPVLTLYLPIRYPGSPSVQGVFTIYQNFQTIYQKIREGQRTIWLVTAGGFLLLYLALYGIVRTATHTITEQTVNLRRSAQQLEEAYVDTIRVLAAAIDAKDPYTSGHSSRIAKYARLVAQKLGFSSQRIRELEKACLFHDIGKIMIPEQVLRKPGKLTPEEIALVKQHPIVGANIIGMANSLSRYVPIVRYHQERYDGTGYPDGLKGDEIPLEAQIIALIDSYDAMITDRPYRKAMTPREAKEEIRRQRGIQFHPRLVDAFLSIPEDEFNRRSDVERRLMELERRHLTERRTGKERRSKNSLEKS